ncbi:MAG: putative DNA-binding domain-containing protein [Steroidobacteraceae bacterium]
MNLREAQLRFAAHIRDPERAAPPADVDDRRMQVYRELFFDNVASLLAGVFPVLERILGPERWRGLVRDFYRDHRCHTPLFLEVSQEFLAYLGEERTAAAGDPPFLCELAHYEWVELALSVDEAVPDEARVAPSGDLLAGIPVLSPLAWPLAYRYPVHRLAPEFQPLEPPADQSFYVACRNRSDEVRFMQANAVTLRLVELLRQHPGRTGRAQLDALARELPQVDRAALLAGGATTLRELRTADIVLGTLVA